MLQDYYETDSSPLASQTEKFFQEMEAVNPTVQFARYCDEFPWAIECKIYDVWL